MLVICDWQVLKIPHTYTEFRLELTRGELMTVLIIS